ncbi:MAG: glycosyltransferase family 39 protein [Peptococcaceae bacterium]|nr:glycosyltransferase family 39 protein [Peptococcaceae bacterium]
MSKKTWFWLILLLGIAIRCYGITAPLLDTQAWRQADTASMAANFVQHGFWPPFPQLNYDGPPPNYVELEFPLIPLLTALVWQVVGQYDIIARAIVIAFSGLTLGFIYRLGKELYDETSGLLAMVFFALNPLAIYYGRAVMPDAAMLFFMTAAAYYMVRWAKQAKDRDLILTAGSFALAGLAKLPALMMGAPLLVPFIRRYKLTVLRHRSVWLFLGIGLLPTFAYYYLAHLQAAHTVNQFVSGIITGQMNTSFFDYTYLRKTLVQMITMPLLLLALGAPLLRKTRIGNAFVWVWLAVLLAYTIIVCSRIQLNYYLLPLLPLLSVLAGATLGRFWGETPGIMSSVLIFGLCAHLAVQGLQFYYVPQYAYLPQAKLIEHYTQPADLLILDDAPPMTFYYSNRKGWRLLPAQQTPQAVEALRAQGAKLFVELPYATVQPVLQKYLTRHYTWVAQGSFFDLSRPKS